MFSARGYVRFGPIADTSAYFNHIFASAGTEGGTMPSVLAVARLIARSYLSDCGGLSENLIDHIVDRSSG
jgi:hypothetical protein